MRRLNLRAEDTILDVGGEPYYWYTFPVPCRVVCLNVRPFTSTNPRVTVEVYEGGSFPYSTAAFDVVHSNSVIEHVGDFSAQVRFAREVARVGVRYWVQVPNFFFPYEPHAYLPFFQFLPANLKLWMLRHWKRAGYDIEGMLSIRLLTAAEVRYLFPDARIHRERFLGLTKSFCAFRGR